MNELLGVSLAQFLGKPLILIGLIFLTIGLATVILARRIARVARHSNDISKSDRVYVTFKIIGLIMMLVGFILVSIDIIMYICDKYSK